MKYFLGLDIGGTYARLKICDENNTVVAERVGHGGSILSIGYDATQENLFELISSAIAENSLEISECCGLCAGISGIDSPELQEKYVHIFEEIGFPRAIITAVNDCELLLSPFKDASIAIISGTGSIAMGRESSTSQILRCGGWHYILNDAGSASDIGQSVLRFALKHWDMQISCPVMIRLLSQKKGIDSPTTLTKWFQQNITKKEEIASLAVIADEAARMGEEAAILLLSEAAAQLSEYAVTIASRIGAINENITVLLWGSVLLSCETLRNKLLSVLKTKLPRAVFTTLCSSALDLAVTLALGKDPQSIIKYI